MPWRTKTVFDQRRMFVQSVLSDPDTSLSAHCRRFGISRPTGYKWLSRFDPDDPASLEDRSRAPHSQPHATDHDVIDQLVSLRRQHPTWGARKIQGVLSTQQLEIAVPCCSTVHQILREHGLIFGRRRRKRYPQPPQPAIAKTPCHTVWTIDYKGQFYTGDHQWCYPLTLMEASTRYLLRCQSFAGICGDDVKSVLTDAFLEFGLPRYIHSDNGSPFASTGLGRLSKLSVWWIRLGIEPYLSRPGHPQDNGAHERFHRTLLEDTAKPPASTRRVQQRVFDAYRNVYNEQRPHEALGMQTPAHLFQTSARPYPHKLPEMEYPDSAVTRFVHPRGHVTWHCQQVFLSTALHGQRVGFFPWVDAQYVIAFGKMPLAVYDERSRHLLSAAKAGPLLAEFAHEMTAKEDR